MERQSKRVALETKGRNLIYTVLRNLMESLKAETKNRGPVTLFVKNQEKRFLWKFELEILIKNIAL